MIRKDLRPIISLPDVIEQKQVLYIALGLHAERRRSNRSGFHDACRT